jgi:hypothetical protein
MTIDQSEPERDSAEGRRSPASADALDGAEEVPSEADALDGFDDPSVAADAVAIPRAFFKALPYVAYLVAAVVLLGNLWRNPGGRMLLDNYQDQVWFEWLLTNGANSLAHFDNPLFSMKINAPYGLNLMANTSVLALAIPFAPVTWLFGADVTFVLVETLALAGTAAAWYFVLNKLLNHRAAAAVGGAFCGFAPAMISQATGHPNLAGQYLLPLILLAVLRLGTPGRRPVVRGLILGGLVILQVFINEELLFLLAMALCIFLIVYASRGRGSWPPGCPTRCGASARLCCSRVWCSSTRCTTSSSAVVTTAACPITSCSTAATWPATGRSRGARSPVTRRSPGGSPTTRPRRTRSSAGR